MPDTVPTGPASDEPAAEEDFRATGDAIRADVARLGAVEKEKRARAAKDPVVSRLSEEAVGLADRIARETRAELQLSKEIG